MTMFSHGQDKGLGSEDDMALKVTGIQKQVVQDLMAQAYIPSLSVASISNGKFVGSCALGVSDIEAKTLTTTDTIFWACSLSKPVFAYLVIKLIARGQLGNDFSLDTPLWTKYDDAQFFANDERRKGITARMILSHQTGLPNEGPIDSKFNPGDSFRYSGEGYVYLQKVIEKQTGLTLETLAQREIFLPLGMHHSSFLLPVPEMLAATHDKMMQPKIPLPKISGNNGNGAGSLHTTASDYALFLAACINDEHFVEIALKTPQVSMQTDKEAIARGIDNKTLQTIHWGLGFGLQKSDQPNEEDIAFHWGHAPGARAFVAINLCTRSAVVYLANSENGLAIAQEIVTPKVGNIKPMIDYLYAKYDYKNAAELEQLRKTQAVPEKASTQTNNRLKWLYELKMRKNNPLKIDKETLQEYTGQYGPLSITHKENALQLELFGQTHALVPLSKTVFASQNDLTFRLEFDKEKRQVTSHFLDAKLQPRTEAKTTAETPSVFRP
jgi:CubicO group peptidase (beta-lactamase class C family)